MEYLYKAMTRQGAILEGKDSAESPDILVGRLKARGLTVLQIDAFSSQDEVITSSVRAFPLVELCRFTRDLSVLMRSGLPIERALKLLSETVSNAAMGAFITDVRQQVKQGKPLSQALAPYEKSLGRFYLSLIKAGEASGRMVEVLSTLADYLEQLRLLRSNVISAMIYPAILLAFAIISIWVMLGFVVPQFDTLFSDMGDALPLPTRVLMFVGDFFSHYALHMLVGSVLLAVFVWKGLKTDKGQTSLQAFLMRLPLVGSLLITLEVARFTRTLGTLLAKGVPMVKALEIALDTLSLVTMKQAFAQLIPAVKSGRVMSDTLKDFKRFVTPTLIQMIRVGEETGRLDAILLDLSALYEAEVAVKIKRLLTLLEPALILTLGVAIAFMVVAILLGILSVNDFIF
ncbi:type II secretion system F family protein [Nitrincola nitratireducens]|uniref:Type II secretion system protein GspF domain-containing protein n=1 Tax=Nitrincola nitratireducens TaxID=1229521 RepID=W9VMQ9_9GAMM|nr:type II secretion system F family protein [Nitrincola nitratireducens]EXJ11790.1 hypothetical protein D791_01163 [Nitrincola nitratireducens]